MEATRAHLGATNNNGKRLLRMRAIVGAAVLAAVSVGCGDERPRWFGPSGVPTPRPSSAPTPRPVTLVEFRDSASGFSTTDIHDADDQRIQLDTAANLIWVDEGTKLPGYSVTMRPFDGRNIFFVEGRFCVPTCALEIRFGIKDGERRAYATADYIHDNPGTLVDLELRGGDVVVQRTDVYPPGLFTMSGRITEATPSGPQPVEGALVTRSVTSGWRNARTDANGVYRMPGLFDGLAEVWIIKDGYERLKQLVDVPHDVEYSAEIVRQ